MKRTYWWNPETQAMEEITDRPPVEWLNTGIRYGSETLAKMKREGLAPMEDFKETWAKAETERARIRGALEPTPEMKAERRRSIAEAFAKYQAGYRPQRGRSLPGDED